MSKAKYLPAYKSIWIPLLLGILLLPVPLLGDFHFESALAGALFGAFAGGWMLAGLREEPKPGDEREALLKVVQWVYLLGIPLLVHSALTGCFSVNGLGFWIFYPLPSILFGAALGRLLRRMKLPAVRTWTVTLLLLVAVGTWLIEFYTLPQVYFFNQVWGGWPGPIYDEAVILTPALLYFRMITLLWVVLFWSAADLRRDTMNRWLFGLAAAALVMGYMQLSEMGVISPRSRLKKELGSEKQTGHFTDYYDSRYFKRDEADFWALRQEFYWKRITDTLQVDANRGGDGVESFWYGHPWQKKALVGAKYTSYVPVWLAKDQVHIARGQMPGSLEHELVHVAAKPFGNRLFNASWSIGLVEGLAVALAGDVSRVSTVDQIVAADSTWPDAAELQNRFSFAGFYKGRSTVNYATAGSFVAWLLRNYPVSRFKRAYRSGDINTAYPVPLDSLVAGWRRHLQTVPLDTIDRAASHRLFAMRSLLEKPCPHEVSSTYKLWDQFNHAMADRDTTRALKVLDVLYRRAPGNDAVWSAWAFWKLKQQQPDSILADTANRAINLRRGWLYADALRMDQKYEQSRQVLDSLLKVVEVEAPGDSLYLQGLEARSDSLQWALHLKATYSGQTFGQEAFLEAHARTQARAIERVLEHWDRETILQYGRWLENQPLPTSHFGVWNQLINRLAFYRAFDPADMLLTRLRSQKLRLRYQQQREETARWIHFLKHDVQVRQ